MSSIEIVCAIWRNMMSRVLTHIVLLALFVFVFDGFTKALSTNHSIVMEAYRKFWSLVVNVLEQNISINPTIMVVYNKLSSVSQFLQPYLLPL